MTHLKVEKAVKLSLFLPLFFLFVCISCKTKKVISTPTIISIQDKNLSIASGTVSHKYSANGCGTVILCDKIKGQDSTVFVPMPMSSLNAFDIDGLKIIFNYRTLRIRNPKGCVNGVPVQVTNVSKK